MNEPSGTDCPTASSPDPVPLPRGRTGIGRAQVMLLIVCVAGLVWGAWTTRAILDLRARPAPFVKVQLERLVAEYVRAQARSATPPDRIDTETAVFMKVLDASLARHARAGEVVLVSEAVVGGTVPDITAAVRREVYARLPVPSGGNDAVPNAGSADGLQNGGGQDGAGR